jgi:hypothetical protein
MACGSMFRNSGNHLLQGPDQSSKRDLSPGLLSHRLFGVALLTITGCALLMAQDARPADPEPMKVVAQADNPVENIVIDSSKQLGTRKSLIGFLHGFEALEGFETMAEITAVKPKFWRTGLMSDRYYTVKDLGAKITWETNIGYYAMTGTWVNECGSDQTACTKELCSVKPAPPRPWEDNFVAYKAYIKSMVVFSVQNNIPIDYWEWWNEPNDIGRFGTQEQMFQTFKAFHDAVREAEKATGVKQKISAPALENLIGVDNREDNDCDMTGDKSRIVPAGTRTFKIEEFLKFVIDNKLRLDALSWHDFSTSGQDLPVLKAFLTQVFPLIGICNPDCPEIHINEYQGPGQSLLPGNTIGWLYNIDAAQLDWANRSCWSLGGSNYCNGGLNGLLMPDTATPQALYWVHRAYADMDGKTRLDVSAGDDHTVALASKDSASKEIRILAGRYCHTGDRTWLSCYDPTLQKGPNGDVQFLLTHNTDLDSVLLEIYKIPSSDNVPKALLQPLLVSRRTLRVVDGVLSFMIYDFADEDAYSIIIKPAT